MSENVPALFGDAEKFINDPRHVLMWDFIAGDYADEVLDIVNGYLADDEEAGDGDGMLCAGDAIDAVNDTIARANDPDADPATVPPLLRRQSGDDPHPRLSKRQVVRLAITNTDYAALLRFARIEANWRLNGRNIQKMIEGGGDLNQMIRWFKTLDDAAFREEGRTIDRAKLAINRERNQAVARSLDNPLAGHSTPGLRRVAYVPSRDVSGDDDAAFEVA